MESNVRMTTRSRAPRKSSIPISRPSSSAISKPPTVAPVLEPTPSPAKRSAAIPKAPRSTRPSTVESTKSSSRLPSLKSGHRASLSTSVLRSPTPEKQPSIVVTVSSASKPKKPPPSPLSVKPVQPSMAASPDASPGLTKGPKGKRTVPNSPSSSGKRLASQQDELGSLPSLTDLASPSCRLSLRSSSSSSSMLLRNLLSPSTPQISYRPRSRAPRSSLVSFEAMSQTFALEANDSLLLTAPTEDDALFSDLSTSPPAPVSSKKKSVSDRKAGLSFIPLPKSPSSLQTEWVSLQGKLHHSLAAQASLADALAVESGKVREMEEWLAEKEIESALLNPTPIKPRPAVVHRSNREHELEKEVRRTKEERERQSTVLRAVQLSLDEAVASRAKMEHALRLVEQELEEMRGALEEKEGLDEQLRRARETVCRVRWEEVGRRAQGELEALGDERAVLKMLESLVDGLAREL